MRQIIHEDHHHTTDEVSMLVGISHGTCEKILTEDLKMQHATSKFVPRLLSVNQKQHDLTFAWTSKKMLLTNQAFFRMSLRVTKPGFTPMTRKPKLNPVNGKVRGHLD